MNDVSDHHSILVIAGKLSPSKIPVRNSLSPLRKFTHKSWLF